MQRRHIGHVLARSPPVAYLDRSSELDLRCVAAANRHVDHGRGNVHIEPAGILVLAERAQWVRAAGRQPSAVLVHLRNTLLLAAARFTIALIVCLCCLVPSSAHAGKRIALVIGNSGYVNTKPLKNPQFDAKMIAEALGRIGFDPVDLKLDLGFAGMRDELSAFNAKAKDAELAVVFFAGHGMEFGGKNFLIPTDARLAADQDIEWEVVPLDLVLTAAQPAKVRIVILDACRNNPLAAQMAVSQSSRSVETGSLRTVSQGLAEVDERDNTLIAYAAKHGSVAYDGIEEDSPYTLALIDHMGTPGVDVRIMFGMVRDNVMRRTRGKQVPYVYGAIGGDQLYLVPPKPGAPADAKEQEFWNRIKDSDVDAMFSLYLQLYPNGRYANEAKSRLAALGKAPVTPSTNPANWPQPKLPGAAPEPALSSEIVIGAAAPLTGVLAAYGNQMRVGAEAAVADINDAGGVLGKRLKLVVADDANDPKTAVLIANQFVGEGVQFVLGHFGSGSSIPASEVYEENGIVMISPASTNPLLTSRGQQFIFRVSSRDDHQGSYAGNFLARHYRDKRIAVIYDGTQWGNLTSDGMLQTMQRLGKEVVLYESFERDQQDYAGLVQKLKAARTDVVYIGSFHNDAAVILRQMRAAGMKTLMVGTDGLMTDEFWQIAGNAAEGTLMTFGPDRRNSLEASAVVQRFRANGFEPVAYTLYAYAAVQAWAEAANRTHAADAARVARMLRTGRFSTVLGTLGFDGAGDVTIPGFAFFRWSKGNVTQLN